MPLLELLGVIIQLSYYTNINTVIRLASIIIYVKIIDFKIVCESRRKLIDKLDLNNIKKDK